jgi:hypothetical protein
MDLLACSSGTVSWDARVAMSRIRYSFDDVCGHVERKWCEGNRVKAEGRFGWRTSRQKPGKASA